MQLLQRVKDKIQPPPQRIIWLYKRWQPLYDVIQNTVSPRVEFMKGVPLNLEKDDFLDPQLRNLIVLDDMAVEAAKDQRVTDLFTEGSHHRNLSVIALNQNLFFSKNPTQRRNSQYLVLFNHPVDKQTIMILARQIYPDNPKELLRHFEEAVSRPYGYLLVDLKATTPDILRMRSDIFDIKEARKRHLNQFEIGSPRVQCCVKDIADNSGNISQLDTSDKMPSCDDCGLVFENSHDLQKHVKGWCPEQPSIKRKLLDDENISSKRMKYDESDQEENGEMVPKTDEETDVYTELAKWARQHNEEKRQQKVDKYDKEGLSTTAAMEKADKKLQDDDLHEFMYRYGTVISYILKLGGGYIHSKIMKTVEKYLERNTDQQRAIRLALRKYKHYFEEYLESEDEETEEENEDSDDETENNDTDEETDNENNED